MSIYDSYLETEVMSAGPVRLVQLLYRAAIGAVGAARQHLAAGAIAERSQQISKVLSIVHELLDSLDREKGGEIALGLAGLANILDPECIVIAGGVVELGPLLFGPVREAFGRHVEGVDYRPPVAIVPARLGERAGAVGAAVLARSLPA